MLKKLRLGISAKLFIAIFSTCMLILFLMHWVVRLSFEQGFIDYIKRGNEQRISLLSDALAEQYQQHNNNWAFLRKDDRLVFRMLRSFEQNPDANNPFPPHGWRTMFWVLDPQHNVIVGPHSAPPTDGPRHAIKTENGEVAGWVVSTPVERLTRSADINFDLQQRHTSWIIVALATLLAALVTWLLSRGLLAPVKRLVQGTHQLSAGNFASRVTVSSQDELGRLAQDFNRLAGTLEKNEHMRRAFMADISHELRTPLAILRGELEALQDGVRKLTPASILSLQSEVATLTKLVEDLHQLSLSDEGALAYRKKNIDLVALLEMTTGAFRDRFSSQQIRLEMYLPASAPLFGDPDRLFQLLTNLLENSLRYSDAGGQLRIRLSPAASGWLLSFDDTPPGVSDPHLQQIFQRFFRSEASRSRASGGSGLGLAICQNIVEAHDGKISAAHSDLGGLRIEVHFPG
ncbi:two-component system sensor histidine kinase BaeA [Erwinia sp. OLTSP20]|uniref:envelope stress sensor histidine kinase BaeS n=1 Tax=unclassified Erwinia TaxID=2622719 RepID=UPI000C17EFAE|nr:MULTISPECIES: two-component system sensor histidine kinase BaeS [unclassified Erwinia]PIJ50554.1 two-component system sensor histidine kinase BaeA [Erwinia sp. OAMSP11]PIJ82202.1 two-component system sensor histidine kinase BaeA [Erwinia sp. OLCASP19]PIJ86720.1 two-component system sensor histidine kinase BaeA [Erwinia sp. OLMDSP33]PIJ89859.1 two-component system sensor histidine kinase BaeA [Erwinia sp. OLFS4]PIJ93148.1 two-component system sensor histidine kinase BaeA [Erwinia sp. OLTSP20